MDGVLQTGPETYSQCPHRSGEGVGTCLSVTCRPSEGQGVGLNSLGSLDDTIENQVCFILVNEIYSEIYSGEEPFPRTST